MDPAPKHCDHQWEHFTVLDPATDPTAPITSPTGRDGGVTVYRCTRCGAPGFSIPA